MAGLKDVRDIVRGALASLFGFSGRLVARTMLMIIAARAYGIEALGLLGLISAITEVAAGIGILGLKRGLLDLLSHDAEHGRLPEARILEAFGLGLSVSFAIAAFVAGTLIVFWPEYSNLAPIILITAPMIVFADIALTAVKFKRVIGWDVAVRGGAEPWGFLALALLFLQAENLENGLLWAYTGSYIIAATFAAIGMWRIFGPAAFLRAKPTFSGLRAIPKRSVPVGISDLGYLALRRVDLIVFSAFATTEAVGLYYAVQQIATIPQRVYSLFEPMMSPVIARLHNRMNASRIKATLIAVCRWVLIIQLALTAPMVIYGDHVLGIFGAAYTIGAGVLALVLLAELIDGCFMAVETPLVFAKPKIPPALMAVALIVEISAIALLSPTLGVYGAATGFLLAILCLNAGRLIMIKKHLQIDVVNVSYITPIAFAFVVSLGLVTTRSWISYGDSAVIALFFVISICVYLLLVRQFALTHSDRVVMRAIFQRRKPSASPPISPSVS